MTLLKLVFALPLPRLAIVICVVYVAVSILFVCGYAVALRLTGGFVIATSRLGTLALFVVIWLISVAAAWLVVTPDFGK